MFDTHTRLFGVRAPQAAREVPKRPLRGPKSARRPTASHCPRASQESPNRRSKGAPSYRWRQGRHE
eukprot:8878401-Pyramimonas_sp.AAC.1